MAQRSPPPPPTIDVLLNLIDTRPTSILSSLEQHPHLASASDSHGYSLVHASVSYAQLPLLGQLIRKYHVDVNILDEDGETALFAAEEVPVATYLVEELGADIGIRNNEGQTAEEKIAEEEGETNAVCLYLKGLRERRGAGNENSTVGGDGAAVQEAESVRPPPPLPNGVKINVGTMEEGDVGEAPDPEVRRRIEELAARDDFQTEEGQRQLRELVTEIVTGMGADEAGRSVRRRVD